MFGLSTLAFGLILLLSPFASAQADFCGCDGIARTTPAGAVTTRTTIADGPIEQRATVCRQLCRDAPLCISYLVVSDGLPTSNVCFLTTSLIRAERGSTGRAGAYLQGFVGSCSEYAGLENEPRCATRGISNPSLTVRRSKRRSARQSRVERDLLTEGAFVDGAAAQVE